MRWSETRLVCASPARWVSMGLCRRSLGAPALALPPKLQEQVIDWAAAEGITAASLTGIGACRTVTLGYSIRRVPTIELDTSMSSWNYCPSSVTWQPRGTSLRCMPMLCSARMTSSPSEDIWSVPTCSRRWKWCSPKRRRICAKRIDADTGLVLIALADTSGEGD